MAIKDLSTLTNQLRVQAQKNNSIVLDDTILSDDQLKRINISFILDTGANLTVSGVKPTDIPDPVGNILTISVGTSSVLNQKNVPVKLAFTINGDQPQALIAATMPATWNFKNSFTDLVQFPYSNFKTTDVLFIYSPASQSNYCPWINQPQEAINLETGLNFAGWLTLDGFSTILTLLADIFGAQTKFKFFGPFSPITGNKYPVGKLSALLSTKDFTIGYNPLALTLSKPNFIAEISKEVNSIQEMDLSLGADFSLGLNFSLGISSTGDALVFCASPVEGKPFTADKIIQLPGGKDFNNFIPDELTEIFQSVGLNHFTLIMLPNTQKVSYIELNIGTVKPWDVLSVIKLERLVLDISMIDPSGDNSLTSIAVSAEAEILKNIFPGKFTFSVDIEKTDKSGWQVASILGQYAGKVKLGDIVNGIVGNITGELPLELNDVYFSNFDISVDRLNNKYVCSGNCGFGFPLAGSQLSSTISINIEYSGSDYKVKLNGSLTIGQQDFTIELDFSKQKDQQDFILIATWKAPGNNCLEIADIARAFGNEDLVNLLENDIPPSMDLDLKSASFTYDFSKKELLLTAVSKNYGNIYFVATQIDVKGTKTWTYLFGVAISAIDLTQLPLIGADLSKLGKIGINDLMLLAVSGTIQQSDVKNLNSLIADAGKKNGVIFPALPDSPQGLDKGVNFSCTFVFNGLVQPVFVGTKKQTSASSLKSLNDSPKDGNGVKTPNGYWITVQKSLGPIYFDKVGVNYENEALNLMFNVSLKLNALTIDLVGLTVGSKLTNFNPKFTLSGLSITFTSGPVAISGGFINASTDDITEYNGEAMINVKAFYLAAMGSYAKKDGSTSLFIFALLNSPPLGGPPYFFVTGVAAGFGYNRGLKIPDLDHVSTFPLVSGFVPGQTSPFDKNTGPGKALAVLTQQNVVPVKIGEDWLAAGLAFTSFEMLKSFALMVVEFGTKLEIDLLGLTTASIPTGDPRPLMFAQLALDVRIVPDDGIISVDAKIANTSYILDSSCHLTGGFAFYIWFGNNPHSGDFVVTLGGYHPNFQPPQYYPTVPRLGFNWVISSSMEIKGGMYFALTPNCLMAGGSLQALWHEGNLKAWFIMGADFLIAWKPYHYEAALYINFGVSYTFDIDLLFTSIICTISVSLGADISLWGPPFSGKAYIHLWIISFTIGFGAGASRSIQPISWEEFSGSFLPNGKPQKSLAGNLMASALGENSLPTDTVCATSLAGGLVKDMSKDENPEGIDWIVNKYGTIFTTSTVIPAKDGKVQVLDQDGKAASVKITFVNLADYDKRNQDFGVGPVAIEHKDFLSSHNVTFKFGDGQLSDKIEFYVKAILKDVPKALWEKKTSQDLSNEALIKNVLVGFEIWCGSKPAAETLLVDSKYLEDNNLLYPKDLTWETPKVITDKPPIKINPITDMEQTIKTNPARDSILLALANNGFGTNTEVDVDTISEKAGDYLLANPVFGYGYWKN